MTAPATVFSTLPGIEIEVGSIATGLAEMWTGGIGVSGEAYLDSDDAKATQMNVVLHLGLLTEPDDAVAQFRTLLEFSWRYPCRVVVLCPLEEESGQNELRAKIYGECHLGRSPGDKRCVEFVILSYPISAREYLENEASICLSTDLPLYYWAHRFRANSHLAAYRNLLHRAKRLLIDSAIAPDGAIAYPWPHRQTVRDLVHARLLPVRQTVGQFLSRYPMPSLCEGLQEVLLEHAPALGAEARVLLDWARDRLAQCGNHDAEFTAVPLPTDDPRSFDLRFTYDGTKSFHWQGRLDRSQAHFEADFGTGKTVIPGSISLLSPVLALSEAMFF